MKNRIIKINVNDIILDYRNASDILNRKCSNNERMAVKGAYLKDDNVLVWLETLPEGCRGCHKEYVFAQLDDPSEQSIFATVTERYHYGFSTITFFEINDKLWALFVKKQDEQ